MPLLQWLALAAMWPVLAVQLVRGCVQWRTVLTGLTSMVHDVRTWSALLHGNSKHTCKAL